MNDQPPVGAGRVCPAEHGRWLAIPLRRLVHNPQKILGGHVLPGQTAVDLGCGPGFFTLPMARMVGDGGTVIGVDLQQEMLDMLRRRAERAGLASRIRSHKCGADSIGLTEKVDFILAFYVIHEVPNAASYLGQIRDLLKPDGRVLLVEPKIHVSQPSFARTIDLAHAAGLTPVSEPRILFSRSAVLDLQATD
jgi:ubiquinone/menaquinone biosynthesis C-methylase UbiE